MALLLNVTSTYFQSDLEKLEGLPVAPFMDRDKVNKPSSQIGFIKFVLLPLFEALGDLFPVIEVSVIIRNKEFDRERKLFFLHDIISVFIEYVYLCFCDEKINRKSMISAHSYGDCRNILNIYATFFHVKFLNCVVCC